MRVTSILAGLSALLASAAAASSKTTKTTTTPTTTTAAGPSPTYFILKAKLKPGQSNTAGFQNMVVAPVNTPASGLGFITFQPELDEYPQFFHLAETQKVKGVQYYNILGKADYDPHTYYFAMMNSQYIALADWQSVGVISGNKSTFPKNTFYTNSSGIQWTTDTDSAFGNNFAGWLMCNWSLLVPQLFWIMSNGGIGPGKVPDSCIHIDLEPIYLSNSK